MKKRRSTKQYQHEKIQRQMQEYLARGGHIRKIESGQSGVELNRDLPFQFIPSSQPRGQDGHKLMELVQRIDARKKKEKTGKPGQALKRSRLPRKKAILDDFGEPVRWVWEVPPEKK